MVSVDTRFSWLYLYRYLKTRFFIWFSLLPVQVAVSGVNGFYPAAAVSPQQRPYSQVLYIRLRPSTGMCVTCYRYWCGRISGWLDGLSAHLKAGNWISGRIPVSDWTTICKINSKTQKTKKKFLRLSLQKKTTGNYLIGTGNVTTTRACNQI
jgi:hypothetical protein